MNTICSIFTLDKTLNIVYNKHTRRYPNENWDRDVFLTFTGAEMRFFSPVAIKIRNTKKGFDYEAYKTKRL